MGKHAIQTPARSVGLHKRICALKSANKTRNNNNHTNVQITLTDITTRNDTIYRKLRNTPKNIQKHERRIPTPNNHTTMRENTSDTVDIDDHTVRDGFTIMLIESFKMKHMVNVQKPIDFTGPDNINSHNCSKACLTQIPNICPPVHICTIYGHVYQCKSAICISHKCPMAENVNTKSHDYILVRNKHGGNFQEKCTNRKHASRWSRITKTDMIESLVDIFTRLNDNLKIDTNTFTCTQIRAYAGRIVDLFYNDSINYYPKDKRAKYSYLFAYINIIFTLNTDDAYVRACLVAIKQTSKKRTILSTLDQLTHRFNRTIILRRTQEIKFKFMRELRSFDNHTWEHTTY